MTTTQTAPTLTVRPIHFTADLETVAARLTSLGLRRVNAAFPDDSWQEFAAPAGGRIGVHYVVPGSELDGRSRLGFEVADLAALHEVANLLADFPGDANAELVETRHGPAVRVTAGDGIKFLIDLAPDGTENQAAEPGAEIAQMWFTRDTQTARELLARLGAAELVTTSGGGWVDTRLPGGGRTQLHGASGTAAVSVGFMYDGDLDQLRDEVIGAGLPQAAVVDEAWGKFLDLGPLSENGLSGLDGELTWVNQEMTDTYGYQVHKS